MTGWSHGYNVSTGYTFGFYRETAPDWIDFALTSRGLVPPRRGAGERFRYLELGSGQGFGLCLLAATHPEGEFVGIDFSPEHTAHARALASDLGLANIRFDEGDFAELGECWPADYGTFDYVVLHGIYSWVPEAIRGSIVQILAAAAEPGAAVYVSYNAMPGWASTLPFQHMLSLLDQQTSTKGIGAVEAGRALFERLEQAGSGVTKALPSLKGRIETTRKQPEAYLVQEYLHENWHPLWCSKVMGELAGAKLELEGTATLAENLLPGMLPAALQELLAEHSAPKVREDLGDCLINQTFRRDLYVRGGRRRHQAELDWTRSYRLMRINPSPVPDEVPISTSYSVVKLNREGIAPLLDALGEASLSLAELAAMPAIRSDPQLLSQKLLLLVHGGWIGCSRRHPQDHADVGSINARIAALAAVGAPYRHLAAARLGSAVAASHSDLLLLDAYVTERAQFDEAAPAMLKQRLERMGHRVAKDGKPLEGEEELAEITRNVELFRSRTLPLWQRLGVIG